MKLSLQKAVKLTAEYSGYPQDVTKDILLGYSRIIKKLLLNGYEVKLPELGTFKLKTMKAKPQRDMILPKTQELITLDAKPTYQKPYFHFIPSFTKEVRKETEDNLK